LVKWMTPSLSVHEYMSARAATLAPRTSITAIHRGTVKS
jgi:hypothetical protein